MCLLFVLILIFPRLLKKSDFSQYSDSAIHQHTTPLLAGSMNIQGPPLALECGFHISFCYNVDHNAPIFISCLGFFSAWPKLIFKYSVIYKHLLFPNSSLFPFHPVFPPVLSPLVFVLTIVTKD